jgi:glutamate synthase domain-containing protein 3
VNEKHAQYTKSQKAIAVLANWDEMVPKFVKVMPRDYKRVLQAIQNAHEILKAFFSLLIEVFNTIVEDDNVEPSPA